MRLWTFTKSITSPCTILAPNSIVFHSIYISSAILLSYYNKSYKVFLYQNNIKTNFNHKLLYMYSRFLIIIYPHHHQGWVSSLQYSVFLNMTIWTRPAYAYAVGCYIYNIMQYLLCGFDYVTVYTVYAVLYIYEYATSYTVHMNFH